MEGMDIWNLLRGGTAPERILYWRTAQQLAVRSGPYKLIQTYEPAGLQTEELFDLSKDPFEQKNIVRTALDLADELRKELHRQMSLDPDGLPPLR